MRSGEIHRDYLTGRKESNTEYCASQVNVDNKTTNIAWQTSRKRTCFFFSVLSVFFILGSDSFKAVHRQGSVANEIEDIVSWTETLKLIRDSFCLTFCAFYISSMNLFSGQLKKKWYPWVCPKLIYKSLCVNWAWGICWILVVIGRFLRKSDNIVFTSVGFFCLFVCLFVCPDVSNKCCQA